MKCPDQITASVLQVTTQDLFHFAQLMKTWRVPGPSAIECGIGRRKERRQTGMSKHYVEKGGNAMNHRWT
jgi:hypothetical protein